MMEVTIDQFVNCSTNCCVVKSIEAAVLTNRAHLDGQSPKAYIENNLLASLGSVLLTLERQKQGVLALEPSKGEPEAKRSN